jgi:hypothetical protein
MKSSDSSLPLLTLCSLLLSLSTPAKVMIISSTLSSKISSLSVHYFSNCIACSHTACQSSSAMQRNSSSHFVMQPCSSLLPIHCSRGESVHSRSVRNKGNGIRGVGGVAHKKACAVHTTNIVSSRQYFVARCHSSYVGNAFGLHSVCVCFRSTSKLVTKAKCADSPRLQ